MVRKRDEGNAGRQSEKFKDAARAAGCDDSEARFDEVMRRLAKKKPEPRKPKSDKQ